MSWAYIRECTFPFKVTVDLPDDLFIAAKKRAAERRRPLRALIERGVRAELAVEPAAGLPPGVDVSDRAAMHESLRQQQ